MRGEAGIVSFHIEVCRIELRSLDVSTSTLTHCAILSALFLSFFKTNSRVGLGGLELAV